LCSKVILIAVPLKKKLLSLVNSSLGRTSSGFLWERKDKVA